MSCIHLANSVTKIDAPAKDAVLVSGSHGGYYPAYLACRAQPRAIVLNDAGVGKDGAGRECLKYCQALGIAAAVIDHRSARIGDAEDMFERGIVSACNASAQALGVKERMTCADACENLRHALASQATPPVYNEARIALTPNPGPLAVWLLDSASLVTASDRGQIIITGSHGGLIGTNSWLALQVDAYAAVFNDAGVGADQAGISRLPALDSRSIAAVTVATLSAKIGDGQSTYNSGVVSYVNEKAAALGAHPGMNCRTFVELLQQAAPR